MDPYGMVETARRHVAEGAERVEWLEGLIAREREAGVSTERAEDLLIVFQDILGAMRADLVFFEARAARRP
jgi:hypothetical protein